MRQALLANAHRTRIAIDVGHGGKDSGFNRRTRVYKSPKETRVFLEKHIAFSVAMFLGAFLHHKAANLCYTRLSDVDVSTKDRVAIVNDFSPACAVSIHRAEQSSGIELVYDGSPEARVICNAISDAVKGEIFGRGTRAKIMSDDKDLFLRKTYCPALRIGFIRLDVGTQREWVTSPEKHLQAARLFAEGIWEGVRRLNT
jgi:N-acetylmuramoyl-L-alanine amidase